MTAFIFDLDGTLANTIPIIRRVAKITSEQYGLPAKETDIDRYIGVPLIITGEDVLGPGRGEEYAQAYARNYQQHKADLQAFPGIIDMLRQLQEAGAQLAIATSKREKPAHETLELIGAAPYFDVVINCESGCGYKPAAGPALRAMHELGSSPAHSWFIGDSLHDIACGQAAGIGTIGVTWGITAPGGFAAVSPTYSCDSVAQLNELLLLLHRQGR